MTIGRWTGQGFMLIAVAAWLAVAGIGSAAAQDKVFRAGAYAVDVTPEEWPVSINGGMRDRQTSNVHDPLHARCLVLDDGNERIVLAVVDSCMAPQDLLDEAKRRIEEATGIPTDRVMISATHCHSAPTLTGVFQSEPNDGYRKYLVGRLVDGVRQAVDHLEPAQVGWAVGADPTQVFNRRWRVRAGAGYENPFGISTDEARMNPGNDNPNVSSPLAPTDPEIPILSVRSTDGRPIALFANYALHYVGGVRPVSGDYFAAFAERIAELIGVENQESEPPFMAAMSNGASGDINNIDYSKRSRPSRDEYEQIEIVADSVAQNAYEAYQTIEYHDWVPLKMAEREIELAVRRPSGAEVERARQRLSEAKRNSNDQLRSRRDIYARETVLLADYPPTVDLKLQAIRIGELGITTIPCEVFVEVGLDLKRKSPLKPSFTVELANGYNGYLPTVRQHALGGYETWRARSSYLEVEAAPKVKRTLLDMLDEVAAD